MLEIRFHGRGGQGIVVGSSIIGTAYFYENKYVQFFPEFGVERRGAPLQAFLRVSDTKIKTHYNIYQPNHIILFDNSLVSSINVFEGLKENGLILVNSKKDPDQHEYSNKHKVATIDADGISLDYNLGNASSPIINAAIAGAFAKVMGDLSIDSVIRAVRESVPAKVEENIMSAKTAYERVKIG